MFRLLPPTFVALSPEEREAAIEALANLLAARRSDPGGTSHPDETMT